MNNKLFSFAAVVGSVGILAIAVALLVSSFGGSNLVAPGSTLTYSSALGRLELYNFQSGVITDLAAIRAPLAGLATATTSVSWGTLSQAVTGAGSSSTIVNIPLGGTIGDWVYVQPAAAVSSTVVFKGDITTTGATNASATIFAIQTATSTSAAIGTVTMRILVLPFSSYVAPSALGSVTTSTPQN